MDEQRYNRGCGFSHSSGERSQQDLYYNKVQHDHQLYGFPIAYAQNHDLLQGHPARVPSCSFTTTVDKEHNCRCGSPLYPANRHTDFCHKKRKIGPAQPLLQSLDSEMRPSASNWNNKSHQQHTRQPPSQDNLSHLDQASMCTKTSMCPYTRQSVFTLENLLHQQVEAPPLPSPCESTADVNMWPYLVSQLKGGLAPPTPACTVTDGEVCRTRVSPVSHASALNSPTALKVDCKTSLLQHHGPAVDIPHHCNARKKSKLAEIEVVHNRDGDSSDRSLPHYDCHHIQLFDHDSEAVKEDDASPLAPALDANLAGHTFDSTLLPPEWPAGDFDYLENWDSLEREFMAGVPDRQAVQEHDLRSLYPSITGLSGLDAVDQIKLDRFDAPPALDTSYSQLDDIFQHSGFVPVNSIAFPDLCCASATNPGSPTYSTNLDFSARSDSRPSHRDTGKDGLLIACKNRGMSYKEIKALGCFEEAESTLRGRYRTLTKPKEERVRKPEWSERDINLLLDSVACYIKNQHKAGSGHGKRASGLSRPAQRIPWKQVADRMARRGAYRYGNATVKKKWIEIVGPQDGW